MFSIVLPLVEVDRVLVVDLRCFGAWLLLLESSLSCFVDFIDFLVRWLLIDDLDDSVKPCSSELGFISCIGSCIGRADTAAEVAAMLQLSAIDPFTYCETEISFATEV